MAKKAIRRESAEERKARVQMMSFIDRVVAEIEEAGIKDEHAISDSDTSGRLSARMTTSYGLRSKRQNIA